MNIRTKGLWQDTMTTFKNLVLLSKKVLYIYIMFMFMDPYMFMDFDFKGILHLHVTVLWPKETSFEFLIPGRQVYIPC